MSESGGSIIPVFNINEVIGELGFSMLCLNSIPPVVMSLKDYVDIELISDRVNVAGMISNVIAGSLLLTYGILENMKPLYATMPILIFGNLLGLGLKMGQYIKKNKKETLY